MNGEEHRRTHNPNTDLRVRKGRNLRVQIYCEGSPRFSGRAQGDATADVEGNGECYGSGGAREAERWQEDGRKKKKEEGLAKPIYKGISEREAGKLRKTKIMIIQLNERLILGRH